MSAVTYLNENAETLALYTTAITRAHGKHHPEVFDVKKIYTQMTDKIATQGSQADLNSDFDQLRQVTKSYAIPSDACPTMTATYEMLAQADQLNQQ
ncbi:iron-sulfur cluster repair di-iron protein, ric [Enterococcus asini]|uniref:iron-sulfur cluster repair di-iron protein, ric n=1 Tax=Enterococcus asini TaxID=57732 RepID=UPI002890CAE2|nr:iron-sulfur cluster repair di-iron protein, ric [Enterococcus asini]MDT2757527.1 iron-sulfur cluster repair di-iron protein, ric [Enterococcus asini]